jgi:SAM-dependent methyltransferase
MVNHDPRELEWERRYEENDTPWDKGAAAPPLVHYLRNNAISGRVLVPGCGRGHDVRALAMQPGAVVTGLDLSPTAIAEATRMKVETGVGASSAYVVGDFFRPAPEMIGAFDWVVEHTCFCALEPRQRTEYVGGAFASLRPGGKIFGIFYLNPDTDSGPPFAISRTDLVDLFTPHFTVLDEWVPKFSFPGRENRELVLILQKR